MKQKALCKGKFSQSFPSVGGSEGVVTRGHPGREKYTKASTIIYMYFICFLLLHRQDFWLDFSTQKMYNSENKIYTKLSHQNL